MRNKLLKIGLIFAVLFTGFFNAETTQAKTNFAQKGAVCKVTKAGGASVYVASLDKYFRIRRGGTMIVVDPEPHQGLIVVKSMINRKMLQSEVKLDDTNCVPILPR